MEMRKLGRVPLFLRNMSVHTKRIHRNLNSLKLTIALICVAGIPGWLAASAATASSVTLTASSGGTTVSSVTWGAVVTLTASVTASGGGLTPGTVYFCDSVATVCQNSTALGTAQLTSSGTASMRFIPGIGEHQYKAVFQGTTAVASGASANEPLTVTGQNPSTTTIASSGTTGQYTLTGTVVGYPNVPTGTVSFVDASDSASLGTASLGATTTKWGLLSASSQATGGEPPAVAQGDFNGDGKMDVVVANLGCVGSCTVPNGLTVLLGNGSGGFTAGPSSPLTNVPVSVVTVGDFNNDGKLDLAVIEDPGTGSNKVAILLGNGDGTFAVSSTISLSSSGSITTAEATADFNGDGNLDLAVADYNTNTVTILLGAGNGSFTASSSPATGSGTLQAVAADFNRDGKIDLATVNSSTISILLGNGDGTFTAGAALSYTGTSNATNLIAVGDFDGDGLIDLAALAQFGVYPSEYLAITVFRGNGDGTFAAGTSFATDTSAGGTESAAIGAGDFNSDGKTDLAYYDAQGVAEYLSNGDGTFTKAGEVIDANPTYPNWNSLVVGDFNGDGLSDVVTVDSDARTATAQLTSRTATATASLANVVIPGSGSHNVEAVYEGDSAFAGSTSSVIALTASPVATQLTLSSSASTVTYGNQITLTAKQNPYAYGSLTTNGGTITFLSNGTSIGTGTLSSGVATLNVNSLAVGTDSITATYPASTYFGTATASAVSVTVNPVPVMSSMSPAFASASGTSFTLTIGGTGFVTGSTAYWGTTPLATQFVSATQLTAQVTAADIAAAGTTAITVQTPGGGASNAMQFEVDTAGSTTTAPTFTSLTATVAAGSTATYSVTLPSTVTSATVTCLNLPTGATCSYSSTAKTVTIATSSTTPAGTYQIVVVFTETVSGAATAAILLPILLLPLVLLKRKLTVRGIWFSACMGLVLMVATAFSIGCGGASSTTAVSTHQVTSSGSVSLTIH